MRSGEFGTKEPAYFVIMQGSRAIVAVKDLARATDMLQGLKQQFPDQDFTVKIRQGKLSEERYRCAECGGAAVNIMADLEEAKKDACYYKVRSRYKVWPSAYASGALVQCRKKGASNWGTKATKESLATSADVVDEQQDLAGIVDDPGGKFDPINMQFLVGAFLSNHKNYDDLQDNLPELIGKWLRSHAAELGTMGFSARDYPRIQTLMHEIMDVDAVFEGEDLEENLRKWFKEKWVRFGPDGKIRGDCARGSEGEGKPKCLPQKKAHSLGKKGRASAAARKRRQDPDADRKGPAKNVATKKEGVAEEHDLTKPLADLEKEFSRHKGRVTTQMDADAWDEYKWYRKEDLMRKFPKLSQQDAEAMVHYSQLGMLSTGADLITTVKNREKYKKEFIKRLNTAFMGHQGVAEETQPLDPRPTVLPPRKEIILFVDGAEVAVYDDLNDAVRDARRFAMKFPNYSIVLKRDVCTRTNLARIQEGQSLGDLS